MYKIKRISYWLFNRETERAGEFANYNKLLYDDGHMKSINARKKKHQQILHNLI